MLVRFCIRRRDPVSHLPQGVFQAALDLRNAGELKPFEEDWLEHELSWLNMHLPSPECLGNTGNERAICWFKPEATRPIEKVRGIIALLESRDVHVETVLTADPGTVIYQDKWQVVAKPRRKLSVRKRCWDKACAR
jgi:hypothetical protein